MVTHRFATAADVPAILTFIRALAVYERLDHEVVATEDGLRSSLFGPAPGAEVVFAEQDGVPIGFALFFHNYSTFLGQRGLWLEDLFVDPDRRGAGVGRGLLAFLASVALDRGCGRLEWAVLDWNAPAIAFYGSLGATPMSDWTTHRLTGDALRTLAGR
ncbi:MAG: GNAT family N-acetyltransferase [Myxococcota bacterium]